MNILCIFSEILTGENQFNLPVRPAVTRGSPLSTKQWREFLTEDGRISDAERVKEIIFRGGIESGALRCEVWKYLLNYYNWDMTSEQKVQHRNRKSQECKYLCVTFYAFEISVNNSFHPKQIIL